MSCRRDGLLIENNKCVCRCVFLLFVNMFNQDISKCNIASGNSLIYIRGYRSFSQNKAVSNGKEQHLLMGI